MQDHCPTVHRDSAWLPSNSQFYKDVWLLPGFVTGVVNVAKACLEAKVPRLVLVSSGGVATPDSSIYKFLNLFGEVSCMLPFFKGSLEIAERFYVERFNDPLCPLASTILVHGAQYVRYVVVPMVSALSPGSCEERFAEQAANPQPPFLRRLCTQTLCFSWLRDHPVAGRRYFCCNNHDVHTRTSFIATVDKNPSGLSRRSCPGRLKGRMR